MAKIVIKEMKGLNADGASLQLPLGEAQNLQNIRNRPFKNWAKRTGVATSSIETSPIMGIFDFNFDNITIPVYQAGGTLHFFPSIPLITCYGGDDDGSLSNPPNLPVYPSPYPNNPLDGYATQTVLFLIEPTMRAGQERGARVNHGLTTYPNRYFHDDGTLITPAFIPPNGGEAPATENKASYNTLAGGTATFPVNNFYKNDLYWYDVYFGNPTGTYAATLVNLIVAQVDSVVNINTYAVTNSDFSLKLEGQATLTYFDSSALWGGAAPSATSATYRTVLTQCKTAIRKLKFYPVFASQTTTSTRGTGGQTSMVSCADVVGKAQTDWAGASWSGSATLVQSVSRTKNDGAGTFTATTTSTRAKITADLSAYPAGSATLYLFVDGPGGGPIGPNAPTGSPISTWGAMSDGVAYPAGSSTTSAYVINSDKVPLFTTTCPIGVPLVVEYGWSLALVTAINAGQLFSINFTFNYNV